MSAHDIIWLAIIGIVSAVAGVYSSHFWKAYPPDIKKHISLAKKAFLFSLQYILPIAAIVRLMATAQAVTKEFVFLVVAYTSIFFFNVMIHVLGHLITKLAEIFRGIVDIQKDDSDLQKRLIAIIKKDAAMIEIVAKAVVELQKNAKLDSTEIQNHIRNNDGKTDS